MENLPKEIIKYISLMIYEDDYAAFALTSKRMMMILSDPVLIREKIATDYNWEVSRLLNRFKDVQYTLKLYLRYRHGKRMKMHNRVFRMYMRCGVSWILLPDIVSFCNEGRKVYYMISKNKTRLHLIEMVSSIPMYDEGKKRASDISISGDPFNLLPYCLGIGSSPAYPLRDFDSALYNHLKKLP